MVRGLREHRKSREEEERKVQERLPGRLAPVHGFSWMIFFQRSCGFCKFLFNFKTMEGKSSKSFEVSGIFWERSGAAVLRRWGWQVPLEVPVCGCDLCRFPRILNGLDHSLLTIRVGSPVNHGMTEAGDGCQALRGTRAAPGTAAQRAFEIGRIEGGTAPTAEGRCLGMPGG